MKPVTLIGAPTDVGASIRGASMGPEALRVADIAGALVRNGLDVTDLGNLVGPGNPNLPPTDGVRHLPEVVAWNRLVMDATYQALAAGQLPLLMGGDHCLAIGSVNAAARYCREQERSSWCSGSMRTPMPTPASPARPGTPMACRWRACAGMVPPRLRR
jgi:arginase